MTTTRRRLQRGLVLLALVALLAAACGDSTTTDGQDASTDSTTSTESTAPEVADEPMTTPDTTEPRQTDPEFTPIPPEDVEVTRDVRYGTTRGEDYRDPLMDVYAPPGEGPLADGHDVPLGARGIRGQGDRRDRREVGRGTRGRRLRSRSRRILDQHRLDADAVPRGSGRVVRDLVRARERCVSSVVIPTR